jgi:MCM AAA-lid domain
MIADHVLGLKSEDAEQQQSGDACMALVTTDAPESWGLQELRQYIAWAKASYHPKLSHAAQQLLLAYYQRQRLLASERHHASDQVTVRFLEGLVRLSQAHARLMARQEATLVDAAAVVLLLDTCAHVKSVLRMQFASRPHCVCDLDDEAHERATEQLLQALGVPAVPLLPAPPAPPAAPPAALPRAPSAPVARSAPPLPLPLPRSSAPATAPPPAIQVPLAVCPAPAAPSQRTVQQTPRASAPAAPATPALVTPAPPLHALAQARSTPMAARTILQQGRIAQSSTCASEQASQIRISACTRCQPSSSGWHCSCRLCCSTAEQPWQGAASFGS